jgi:REP element-mobilizing transposase RayT
MNSQIPYFPLLKYFTMGRYRIVDQQGLHFVTCTVVGWIDIFSRKKYRDIVLDSLSFCRKEKGLLLFAYIIMSNHLHLVLQTGPTSTDTLSDILPDFKKFTANTILASISSESESRRDWLLHMFKYYAKYKVNNRNLQFWQQDNHSFSLFSEKMIWQKVNYIHNNPVRAGIVDRPEDYVYSSARNYARGNKDCLIEIDLLEPWWSDVGKV